MLDRIPILDHHATNFSTNAATAFHDIGFLALRAPSVTPKCAALYAQSRRVFDLPLEVKMSYRHEELAHQRGYAPLYNERAIMCRRRGKDGSDIGDRKEMWSAGIENPDPKLTRRFPFGYGPNVWPKEVPEFREAMLELWHALFPYGMMVLRAVVAYAGKSSDYFDTMVANAPHFIRALCYPAVLPEEAIEDVIGACDHTDINLATVLPAPTRPSLFIRPRGGKVEWIPGNSPEAQNCVLVQVGDEWQYLTDGDFLSALHKVESPQGVSPQDDRLSAALFIHAHPEIELHPGMTADAFLQQRLAEIGLK